MRIRNLVLVFAAVFVILHAIDGVFAGDFVSLQGNVKSGGIDLASGNLQVLIYDASSGGNLIYNSSTDFNNSIANGKYDVLLGNTSQQLNLNYGQKYYFEIYVNGERLNYSGGLSRQVFQSAVGNITSAYMNISDAYVPYTGATNNVNLNGKNITNIDRATMGTANTALALLVQEGAVMFNGTLDGPGVVPVNGSGIRLMWIPAKASFREGSVNNGEWDNENIGYYSFSVGENTRASGNYSNALGYNSSATGDYSFAFGNIANASGLAAMAFGAYTIASGSVATAMGYSTTASGEVSTAMGQGTTASGHWSTAIGLDSTASGNYATVIGRSTTASGEYSTAMGRDTIASGVSSTAMGSTTTASGVYSTAMGYSTTASGNYSTAAGKDITCSQNNAFCFGGGNMGVGTGTPAQKLDVRGDGNFSGTIYIKNNTDISLWMYNQTIAAMNWTTSQSYLTNGTNAWFNTLTIGTSTFISQFRTDIAGDVRISGNLTVLGNITNLNVQSLGVNGSIIPEQDAVFDLGNSSNRW